VSDGRAVSVLIEGVRLPFSRKAAAERAAKVLAKLKGDRSKISIVFVDDSRIRKLNSKYRKIDSPTDVLAFPTGGGRGCRPKQDLLGDIVISVETAKKNARYFGSDLKKELTLYMIHGILHLLGYDDTTTASRKKMRLTEERLLKKI